MGRSHSRLPMRALLSTLLLAACALPAHSQQSTSGPVPPPGISRGLRAPLLAGLTGTGTIIPGVPAYLWHHGCGPTAVGMVVGYWDAHGFPDLVPGDASTPTAAVMAMIANDSGNPTCGGSGDHYQDYACPRDDGSPTAIPDRSSTGGAHASNCVADFMRTSWSSAGNCYGWSWGTDVLPAFVNYVRHVAPQYTPFATNSTFAGFSWDMYKAEIDAGRPVVLLVDTDGNGGTDHFVTAIGYYEDTGQPQFAIYDTWDYTVHWFPWHGLGSGSWGIYTITTFGLLEDVAALNSTVNDYALALSGDGRLAIEESTRDGGTSHLFQTSRAAEDSAFGAVSSACGVNSGFADGGPWLSWNARRLYFASTRLHAGAEWDLFEAARPDPDSCFATPTPIAELNAPPCSSSDPTLPADELEILFSRSCSGGAWHIWHATRTDPSAPFGAPESLTVVNSTANDLDPHISRDGLELYFSSNRSGGLGGYDLWHTTRASRGSAFGAPTNVKVLNSLLAETHPCLSMNGTELYFSSNRTGGIGGYDLWRMKQSGSPLLLAVNDPSPAAGARALAARARPNPFRASTTIETALPAAGRIVADVFDAGGRRVRRIEGTGAGPVVRLVWDGRTGAGAPAAPGTYFVRVESGGLHAVCRTVRVE